MTGRTKKLIVLGGGKNICPEDVERAYESAREIAEAAVFERTAALFALVVPNTPEIAKHGSVAADGAVKVAVMSIVKELPSTQRLAGFRLRRQELPRTRLPIAPESLEGDATLDVTPAEAIAAELREHLANLARSRGVDALLCCHFRSSADRQCYFSAAS